MPAMLTMLLPNESNFQWPTTKSEMTCHMTALLFLLRYLFPPNYFQRCSHRCTGLEAESRGWLCCPCHTVLTRWQHRRTEILPSAPWFGPAQRKTKRMVVEDRPSKGSFP